jgi:hypothetical protein
MCEGRIELVDAPVIDFFQFQRAGIVAGAAQRHGACGVAHFLEIGAHIEVVQLCVETRRPCKDRVRINVSGTVSRVGVVSRPGRNREAPDVSYPWTVGLGFVDLVDSPVIGGARNQTVGIGKSREADDVRRIGLVSSKRIGRTVDDIVEILAEI